MMVRVQATMWDSNRKRVRRPRWWLPVLTGLAISVAQVALVARAWSDCAIIGAIGLSSTSLYALGLPALTFLNTVLVALPAEVWLGGRRHRGRRVLVTLLSVAVLVAAETLVLGHFVATPESPVGTECVGNVPPWWPTWMPT